MDTIKPEVSGTELRVTSGISPLLVSTAPAQTQEPAQIHASVAHHVFGLLDKILHTLQDPTVLALLPPKYRGYAMAATAVEHTVQSLSTSELKP